MSYQRIDRWICDFCERVAEVPVTDSAEHRSAIWPDGWRHATISGSAAGRGQHRDACLACAARLEIRVREDAPR